MLPDEASDEAGEEPPVKRQLKVALNVILCEGCEWTTQRQLKCGWFVHFCFLAIASPRAIKAAPSESMLW